MAFNVPFLGTFAHVWIVGLGTQYPEHLLEPDELESIARRHHNTDSEGLKKLLIINNRTGIEWRASALDTKHQFFVRKEPPTIEELNAHFRDVGVRLAMQACKKALHESGIANDNITHTVAVTCTDQGNPGYDVLVNQQLGLSPNVDRMLLHGVGCAGGLAIMRAAAQVALAASARGRPARVLAYACELCTPNLRSELLAAEACLPEDVCVAAALFSDAAAAFVMVNDLGRAYSEAMFEVMAFDSAIIPDTVQHMSFYTAQSGFRTTLSRTIPTFMTKAARNMFDTLAAEYSAQSDNTLLEPRHCDWAVHPGGRAILDGVQNVMKLMDDQLAVSRGVYQTRGNSSSPTVLVILDTLRRADLRKEEVVAAAFGPGLCIEMAILKRR